MNIKINRSTWTLLLLSSLLGIGGLSAQQSAAPADNTTVNQRDRNPNEPTADQQKNIPSDRDITKQIREAIVKDKSLSTYAHNVKIITQNGHVILKGGVRTGGGKGGF